MKEAYSEILTNSHTNYGGYTFQRYGALAQVKITTTHGILPNEWVYLGTIKNIKLRPKFESEHKVYSENGQCYCHIKIETNGNVSIYASGSNAGVNHNIDSTYVYVPV